MFSVRNVSVFGLGYVGSVTDICRVGDFMAVKAISVDDQDRVKLSRKAALAERGEVDPKLATLPPRPPGGGDRPYSDDMLLVRIALQQV